MLMCPVTANLMQNLETYHGRDFKTVFKEKPFKLLFHDTTKLRIRLEDRDLSIPISILLLGISQLLARREFSRGMCLELLGKEWGYQYVARLLLECDDVCLKADTRELALVRVRRNGYANNPVNAPPNGCRAVNPAVR